MKGFNSEDDNANMESPPASERGGKKKARGSRLGSAKGKTEGTPDAKNNKEDAEDAPFSPTKKDPDECPQPPPEPETQPRQDTTSRLEDEPEMFVTLRPLPYEPRLPGLGDDPSNQTRSFYFNGKIFEVPLLNIEVLEGENETNKDAGKTQNKGWQKTKSLMIGLQALKKQQ